MQGLEPRQESLLGLGRRPRREIILLNRPGQAGIAAEQAFRLGLRKTRKLGRLQVGRTPIGIFYPAFDLRYQHRGEPEADVDRR